MTEPRPKWDEPLHWIYLVPIFVVVNVLTFAWIVVRHALALVVPLIPMYTLVWWVFLDPAYDLSYWPWRW